MRGGFFIGKGFVKGSKGCQESSAPTGSRPNGLQRTARGSHPHAPARLSARVPGLGQGVTRGSSRTRIPGKYRHDRQCNGPGCGISSSTIVDVPRSSTHVCRQLWRSTRIVWRLIIELQFPHQSGEQNSAIPFHSQTHWERRSQNDNRPAT